MDAISAILDEHIVFAHATLNITAMCPSQSVSPEVVDPKGLFKSMLAMNDV